MNKKTVPEGTVSDYQKASQSSPPKRRIKSDSFSAGACTWQKILYRLRVWNLFTIRKQILRVADCKTLAEKAEGLFRQVQTVPERHRF